MRITHAAIAAVVALVGILALRTVLFRAEIPPIRSAASAVLREGAADRLAGAIRIPTISTEDPSAFDAKAFEQLHAYLQQAFPLVHGRLRRETVAGHSLLYTWPGRDPSANAILLSAHMDVVPVEPGTETTWQRAPFSGDVSGGFVWGRGAIDNKSAVLGTLEAVETLLSEGFVPARTIHLAYGHDEEVGGTAGARTIAALLESRGARLELVVDEGGVIGEGVLPGLTRPVALVGVAEKGFVTIELNVRIPGGHSSLPPARTAIGVLSDAVARIERTQMPARLEGAARELFETVGPHFPFAQKAIFANLWLTRPFVLRKLQATPSTNAMVRTTTAPTIFQAGTKDNVLPSQARAAINFRILPGDSIQSVTEHVKRVIDDDRIEVKVGGRFTAEPSAASPTAGHSFQLLSDAVRTVAPDALVAPFLVVVVTDARHYSELSSNVFRFLPLRLRPADLDRIHGLNERIAVPQYEAAIRTYRQLIATAAAR
jgi:carboxypeptidase PM20D1